MADEGAGGAKGRVEVVELAAAQQSFARRVAESKATAPHVYFELGLATLPELATLVSACGHALSELPLLNGSYRDGRVERHARVNVAIGIPSAGTLVFPVIQDADRKDDAAIAVEISELRAAAANGSLTAPQLAGATFTVIDMSDAGAGRFTPVINRGQAGTLGVGTAAVVLACDNRIVQGAEGAEFLELLAASLG
jgi:pyruvate dehydrogenase E2 component (dihydrolipoamide acetyltransferase)